MTILFLEQEKEWEQKQKRFIAHCEAHIFENNEIAWDYVPEWVIEEGIDLYFGPKADIGFYEDAVSKLDPGDYAQLIVNVAKNETDDLEAASELKKNIRSLLINWIHRYVDEKLETAGAGYDPAEQSREPY